MIRVRYVLIATFLVLNTSQTARADDALFNPSFSSMLGGASAFAAALINYGTLQACASDPLCGMPDDPSSGFEVGAGSCCDNNDDCFNDFGLHVNRLDRALFTLYKNERHHNLVMRIQGIRMSAMRGAGSLSAAGAAVVARLEITIAKEQKKYFERFNAKTNINICEIILEIIKISLILIGGSVSNGTDSWGVINISNG